MTREHVALERRFSSSSPEEFEPELWAALAHYSREPTHWAHLEKLARVVVLAEAGSGKSHEMREEVRRRAAGGCATYYLKLDELAATPRLQDLLLPDQELQLEAWKAGANKAHFFLDSVDEAKLRGATLEQALRSVARAIAGAQDRAVVVLSSRPSDWNASVDAKTFERLLPAPAPAPAPELSGEELFMAVWRDKLTTRRPTARKTPEQETRPSAVKTFYIVPLDRTQVRVFAEARLGENAPEFLELLDREHAWSFARRPLDLEYLFERWKPGQTLGPLTEQLESDVRSRLQEIDERVSKVKLDDGRALEGAERLALALSFTRKLTIQTTTHPADTDKLADALDPALTLDTWPPAERAELLRRGLFDPGTFGRVRFHHRGVLDFLAARRLRTLNIPPGELLGMFFGTIYSQAVVFPNRLGVATWLAQWEETVARRIIDVEPSALINGGDPAALSISVRTKVLHALYDRFAEGEWHGLHFSYDGLRRFAHPDLAPTIRELWARCPRSQDMRQLLAKLVWQGSLKSCRDLMLHLAFDRDAHVYLREIATSSLLGGPSPERDTLVKSLVTDSSSWPAELIRTSLTALYPAVVSVGELVDLLRTTSEKHNTTGSIENALRQIVAESESNAARLTELMRGLTALVEERCDASNPFHTHAELEHVVPALAEACATLLARSEVSDEVIRAATVAGLFGHGQRAWGAAEALKTLSDAAAKRRDLRPRFFEQTCVVLGRLAPTADPSTVANFSGQHGLTQNVEWESDRDWVLPWMEKLTNSNFAAAGVFAVLYGRRAMSRAKTLEMVADLRASAMDCAPAIAALDRFLQPQDFSGAREFHEQQAKWARQAREQDEALVARYRALLEATSVAFDSEHLQDTLEWLGLWMAKATNAHELFSWNEPLLERATSRDIVHRVREGLRAHWRAYNTTKQDQQTRHSHRLAIAGLNLEAAHPDWTTTLSPAEVRLACSLAATTSNGLPTFAESLLAASPKQCAEVFGAALAADEERAWPQFASALAVAPESVRRAMAPSATVHAGVLLSRPSPLSDREVSRLDNLLRIVRAADEPSQALIERCLNQFESAPSQKEAGPLLHFLSHAAPLRTSAVLLSMTDPANEHLLPTIAEHIGARFENARASDGPNDPDERALTLGNLTRAAFRCLPARSEGEDGTVSHGGSTRRARDALHEALLTQPGPAARQQVAILASEPSVLALSDRLRARMVDNAALDAEPPPAKPSDVRHLEQKFLLPPRGSHALFEATLRAIEELGRRIVHADVNMRETLASLDDEHQMRDALLVQWEPLTLGDYLVKPEGTVADGNRADMMVFEQGLGSSVAIELKLAQSWSTNELERALEAQLIERYLRDPLRTAGCLLLTDNGKKGWQRPGGGTNFTFQELLAHLRKLAADICERHHRRIEVAVLGIDLRKPDLSPAHGRLTPRSPDSRA